MQVRQFQELSIRGNVFQQSHQLQLNKHDWVQRKPSLGAVKGLKRRPDNRSAEASASRPLVAVAGKNGEQAPIST